MKFIALIITGCVLAAGAFVICLRPVTYEMWTVEGYYTWSQGRGELTYPIYEAFTRDYRLRDSLVGEPVDWILDRFPEASKGYDYSPLSYRSLNAPTKTGRGEPIDSVYWLNGRRLANIESELVPDEDDFGFCVLVRGRTILGFHFVKG